LVKTLIGIYYFTAGSMAGGCLMSFIMQFFHKAPEEVTESDIERFIEQGFEENLHLEYKSIELYDDVDKLSYSVSAFANADGGLLILGIREREEKDKKGRTLRIEPGIITWGGQSLSKERLESKLISRIQPRIDGLCIYTIRNGKGGVIFLIDVPKSDRPHQAADHRYYKRWSFQKLPMEHYEIEDLFHRASRTNLEIAARIISVENRLLTLDFVIVNTGTVSAHSPVFQLMVEKGLVVWEIKKILTDDISYPINSQLVIRPLQDAIHPELFQHAGRYSIRYDGLPLRMITTVACNDTPKKEFRIEVMKKDLDALQDGKGKEGEFFIELHPIPEHPPSEQSSTGSRTNGG